MNQHKVTRITSLALLRESEKIKPESIGLCHLRKCQRQSSEMVRNDDELAWHLCNKSQKKEIDGYDMLQKSSTRPDLRIQMGAEPFL